jgi:hypothetical protein
MIKDTADVTRIVGGNYSRNHAGQIANRGRKSRITGTAA